MSYRKKHIKSKIQKIKPKRSIFVRLWFWIIFLFLIIVISAFYFFVFYSGVQVKKILISGNQKISSQDIENLILDNTNNRIFGIRGPLGSWQVNSRSIFLVNTDKLEKATLNKFLAIESVKINKIFMQTLEVQINERVPVAVFCPSLVETNQDNCYFADDNGIIFEPLNVLPSNMIIVRQSINDSHIFTGEKIVQQNIIDLILKVEKDLKDNFQIGLKEALVTSPVRLNVNTSGNWQIYFDLSPDSDPNLQITKLNILLNGGISASDIKNLRYINLIPNTKAIVCDNKTCGE